MSDKHKREDGKVYGSDAGEKVMERLETLESVISGATMAIEKKIYDRTISLDDEAIKQFLDLFIELPLTLRESSG